LVRKKTKTIPVVEETLATTSEVVEKDEDEKEKKKNEKKEKKEKLSETQADAGKMPTSEKKKKK
jgi:hypothetical protein